MSRARPSPVAAQGPGATAATSPCWSGVVAAVANGGSVTVRTGRLEDVAASRAASCLLLPGVGDTVACLRTGPDEVWVLAVLERESAGACVLQCSGDTELRVVKGSLSLQADAMQMESQSLEVRTKRARFSTDTAEVVGRQLRLIATSMKLVGSVLTSVMDRVTHFSRNYQRTTEGTHRIAAMHVEMEAEQLLRLQGEHALVNGTKLVKARGAQIHFG